MLFWFPENGFITHYIGIIDTQDTFQVSIQFYFTLSQTKLAAPMIGAP